VPVSGRERDRWRWRSGWRCRSPHAHACPCPKYGQAALVQLSQQAAGGRGAVAASCRVCPSGAVMEELHIIQGTRSHGCARHAPFRCWLPPPQALLCRSVSTSVSTLQCWSSEICAKFVSVIGCLNGKLNRRSTRLRSFF
jgi:hypothetical protein